MSAWERWSLHVLTSVVGLTGLAHGAMKYLMSPADPFDVVNHPWQPVVLALHIVAAPLLVLVVGMTVRSHIVPKLSNGRSNRRSGFVAIVTFLVMTMSGYLLQVVTGPAVARLTLWVHLVSATLFLVIFLVHLVVGRRLLAVKRRTAGAVIRQAAA